MNRRITSWICAVAMLISSFAAIQLSAFADSTELLKNGDFETGDTSSWYAFGNGTNPTLDVTADDVKSGIYSAVTTGRTSTWMGPAQDVAGIVTGQEYTFYADVKTSTSTDVTLSAKYTDDDGDHYLNLQTATTEAGTWTSVSGTYTFADGVPSDITVYFQSNDANADIYLDNASLTTENTADDDDNPTTDLTNLFTDDFSDDTQADSYEVYDSSVAPANTKAIENGALKIEFNNGDLNYGSSNGIRKDITEYVKDLNGETISASADFKAWYYGTAKLFIEVVSSSGTATQFQLDSGGDGVSSGEVVPLSGSTTLSFSDGDTVYLCITEIAGTHVYDNISLSSGKASEEPDDPDNPDTPSGETTELIKNGDFETGDTSGWYTFGGTITASADAAKSGSYGSVTTDRTANYNGPAQDITGIVTGQEYTFYADVKTSTAADVKMTVKYTDDNNEAKYLQLGNVTTEADTWASISGTYTFEEGVPSDATVYFESSDATTDIYLDNVSLKTEAEITYTEYVTNGDFETGTTSGWYTFGGTISATDAAACSGSYGSVTTDRTATYNGPAQNISGIITGQVYTYYADVKTSTAADVTLSVKYTDDDGDHYLNLQTVTTEADKWTSVSGTYTFGDDVTSDITIYFQSSDENTDIYLDNVSLTTEASSDDDEPDTEEQVAPKGATTFFHHTFTLSKEATLYSAYADGTTAKSDSTLAFTADAASDTNGIATDVTEYVKLGTSGDKFGASLIMKADSLAEQPAKMFIEVRGSDGTVKNTYNLAESGTDLTDGWLTTPISGEASIEFEDGDKIYLCVTQYDAAQYYDNIYFWGTLTTGTEGTVTGYAPMLSTDGTKAVAAVNNTTDEDTTVYLYNVKYNDDNTLASVKAASEVVAAGELNKEISIDAAAGDTVLLWNEMTPLAEPTVLEASTVEASWATSLYDVFDDSLRQDTLDFSGKTVRQKIRLNEGGDRFTITLSNEYGYGSLEIDEVHVALSGDSGSYIQIDTDTPVTFGGSESVTVAKGETVTSDTIYLDTEDMSELFITMKLGDVPYSANYQQWSTGLTCHGGARTTSYYSAGEDVASLALFEGSSMTSWIFIESVDMMTTSTDAETLVCFGDSITDGVGSGTDKYNSYPSYLASYCKVSDAAANVSVINSGIGGNTVAYSGSVGPTGVKRFERDALNVPGVKYIVLLEGINDIGKTSADETFVDAIETAYTDFVAKAHEKGIKIYCGTILPCNGNSYYSENEENLRAELNNWIKANSVGFDGVLDFDAAMQDSADPTKLNSEYDCGDGLHPSPAGYALMAQMVYDTVFGSAESGSAESGSAESGSN